MAVTTAQRTAELVERALEAAEDREQRFRLRTALQLLTRIEEQHEIADEVLADCDLDERTRENLQHLGYLD